MQEVNHLAAESRRRLLEALQGDAGPQLTGLELVEGLLGHTSGTSSLTLADAETVADRAKPTIRGRAELGPLG